MKCIGYTGWAGLLLACHVWGNTAAAEPGTAAVAVTVTPARQSLGKSDDVLVTVTMTNTSAATAWLLKWQTPFAGVEAPLFEVTRDGLPVRYLGIQAKRPPPGAADYIALKAGASRSVQVELSALYRMDVTGAYSVRYRAERLAVSGKPGGAAAPSAATAVSTAPAASVWIDGRVARGGIEPEPAPPAGTAGLSYQRCSNAQQDTIAAAAHVAQAMADDGNAYLQNKTLAARYAGWFGPVDAARAATASQHFGAIRDAFATKPVTVDCGCTASYYAYVYPDQPYTIHVCKAFWSAPLTGTDSKGGTLVHEMSHFNVVAGTDDWAYGQAAAGALATSDPAKALDNADSHEYFGENNPYRALRGR